MRSVAARSVALGRTVTRGALAAFRTGIDDRESSVTYPAWRTSLSVRIPAGVPPSVTTTLPDPVAEHPLRGVPDRGVDVAGHEVRRHHLLDEHSGATAAGYL